MNLTQLWNTIVRGAIYRLMWRLPPWALWAIVGLAFLMALTHARAEMCDFEHHCYPGQTYHMDPAHPDRETPPPAPQYAPPTVAAQPQTSCHIILERREGEPDFQAIEVCTLSPEREARIRREMGL